MNGLAVTSGARIPHQPQGGDPYFNNVILLFGMGDFADHSPLNLGTAVPNLVSLDATNPLGGLSSLFTASQNNAQSCTVPTTLSIIDSPFIAEAWFNCAVPGDGNSHAIFSGRDPTSHIGLYLIVVGTQCTWVVYDHLGGAVPLTSQVYTPGAWNYTAALCDSTGIVPHIGAAGGMTTPGAVHVGDAVGGVIGPTWAFMNDNNVPQPYAGNAAQIRVTRHTTRGHLVQNGVGVGVSYPVPSVPFPLS